jgi:Ala-tRNA(Pro) deacylase
MFVSQTVAGFLDRCGVDFDVVTHRHSATSVASAHKAHIESSQLAKAVLMRDENEYLLVLVPASRRVNAWALQELLDREQLFFATEEEMPFIFRDCAQGAVPAVGAAFGLTTVVDEDLLCCREVYFEGGDHEHLVHMRGESFATLMADQPHGHISC